MPVGFGRTLADLGTVSYEVDGRMFVFPPALFLSIQSKPIYTQDGRAVKYRLYTFTIDCVITAEDMGDGGVTVANGGNITIDATGTQVGELSLHELRKMLTTPGGTFRCSGHGFGTTFEARTNNDVAFGPRPQIAEFSLAGTNRALHLKWQIEVAGMDCQVEQRFNPLLEYTKTIEFQIDESGLFSRVITIYAECQSFRKSDGGISQVIDAYRNQLIPPTLPGFHRRAGRQIANDGKSMTLTIVDSEINSPWPFAGNFVDMQADYTVRSHEDLKAIATGSGMSIWAIELNGKFTVKPGVSAAVGWAFFLTIMKSRLAIIDRPGRPALSGLTALTSISITEQLFARTTSIRAAWVASLTWEAFLVDAKMWQKFHSGTWEEWRKSLDDPYVNDRGYATPDDFKIHESCSIIGSYTPVYFRPNQTVAPKANPLTEECPHPDHSYLRYHLRAQVIRSNEVIEHKPLSTGDSSADFFAELPTQIGLDSSGVGSTFQERTSSSLWLILYGSAERICYAINKPKVYVDGQLALVEQETIDLPVAPNKITVTDLPVYTGTFIIRYRLDPRGVKKLEYKNIPARYQATLPKKVEP